LSNKQDIVELLQNEFVEYAAPILINNLPSIDGLLPVNRKVIWALHKNNITHNKPFIKMLRAS
jgi:DNA gyrase/topoisomerase IV subunit A